MKKTKETTMHLMYSKYEFWLSKLKEAINYKVLSVESVGISKNNPTKLQIKFTANTIDYEVLTKFINALKIVITNLVDTGIDKVDYQEVSINIFSSNKKILTNIQSELRKLK